MLFYNNIYDVLISTSNNFDEVFQNNTLIWCKFIYMESFSLLFIEFDLLKKKVTHNVT